MRSSAWMPATSRSFNTAAEHVFRCPASDAIGGPSNALFQAVSRSACRHMRRFGETGGANRKLGILGTFYGLRADGEEFPMEASISQIHLDGQHSIPSSYVILPIVSVRKRHCAGRSNCFTFRTMRSLSGARRVESSSGARALRSSMATNQARFKGLFRSALFKTGFPRPWQQIEAELRERGLWEGELRRTTKTNREVVVSSRLQLVSGSGAPPSFSKPTATLPSGADSSRKLLEIIGAEQRRIGQDLHDGLCQHLAGIEFRTSVLADQLANSPKRSEKSSRLASLFGKEPGRRECSRAACRL